MDYNYKQLGQRYYPMIPLLLSNKDKTHETDALIDSGSMLSLFRLEVAHQLGIDYKKGNPTRIRSVQGELLIYVHTLRLRIGENEFPFNVGFSEDFKPNLNLLGRTDFFEQFKITFDEKNKKLSLESY